MAMITTAHSTSLDGFIAGADDSPDLRASDPMRRHGIGGDRLFDWLSAGDTPSRINPSFKMSAPSAEFFDEGVPAGGTVIAGRHTYDVSGAWGGAKRAALAPKEEGRLRPRGGYQLGSSSERVDGSASISAS